MLLDYIFNIKVLYLEHILLLLIFIIFNSLIFLYKCNLNQTGILINFDPFDLKTIYCKYYLIKENLK